LADGEQGGKAFEQGQHMQAHGESLAMKVQINCFGAQYLSLSVAAILSEYIAYVARDMQQNIPNVLFDFNQSAPD